LKVLLPVLLSLCVAVRAHAEMTCPTYADVDVSSISRAVAAIEPQMTQCADDPIATGLFGGLLLRMGRISEALVWLEKALLLDPTQAGVKADYALALRAEGDLFSSRAIASDLLGSGSVPQTLKSVLDELSEGARWQSRVSGSIGTGFSSNIDFVPNLDFLDVTFGDDGSTRLPLAEPSKVNSAGFFQQSMRLDLLWEGDTYSVGPGIRVLDRRTGGAMGSDYISTLGSLRVKRMDSDSVIELSYGQIAYGDGQDRGQWGVGYRQPIAHLVDATRCDVGFTADIADQQYNESPINDAQIYQLGVSGYCDDYWFWSADLRSDVPVGPRVGGDRLRWSLSGGRSVPVERGVVILSSGVSVETDEAQYSPFLDRGEPRSVTTLELGVSWQIPVSRHLILATEAAMIRQSSNIALFDASASEISINLIYTP
jgi:hypothetical protein